LPNLDPTREIDMKFESATGAKCTVVLTFDYDAESVEMGYYNSILGNEDIGGFSVNYGVPRILELLNKYGVKGTFFVAGWDAERHPESVEEIISEGHEVAAHGYCFEDFSILEPNHERGVFEKAHQILGAVCGSAPRGFRNPRYGRPVSANTLGIARDMAYIYDSSFLDEDIPYLVRTEEGRLLDIVEIPWVWPLNDLGFMSPQFSCGIGMVLPPRTPNWVLELWKEEFDSLYEEVGFFHLVVHPRDMGRGSRIPVMEGIMRFIRGYPDVHFATCTEVADYCLRKMKE
jgi:peptidoglycan-N-acetylglucosamine deacetylase